ncbi:hypothetical protein ZHAS_00021914 [Anopheles sinensis]|uniref:Uncharacterized protein n=1 Tax=Anopheles sinensis TaxID=74873 RepID=A0A084WTX3_ANOSI|nr:hypothetical protein ZHAS_00021914 [Anopheles sinensis]
MANNSSTTERLLDSPTESYSSKALTPVIRIEPRPNSSRHKRVRIFFPRGSRADRRKATTLLARSAPNPENHQVIPRRSANGTDQ